MKAKLTFCLFIMFFLMGCKQEGIKILYPDSCNLRLGQRFEEVKKCFNVLSKSDNPYSNGKEYYSTIDTLVNEEVEARIYLTFQKHELIELRSEFYPLNRRSSLEKWFNTYYANFLTDSNMIKNDQCNSFYKTIQGDTETLLCLNRNESCSASRFFYKISFLR